MPVFVWVLLCLSLVAAGTVYYSIAVQKVRAASWESLVAQIQQVDRKGIELVALDLLQPQENQVQLGFTEMWKLLGGLEGLERMRANASILIALAAYVQQWNQPEAIVVAERMRRDALQLKKAVFHVRLGLLLRRHPIGQPFYVHDAAAAYYLMTRRLLTLYQTNHVGLLPQLSEVL
jgi:hypothetical protein